MSTSTSLEPALWDAIAALTSAIDGRNHTTGHSLRVADYAVRIAKAMGWSQPALEQLRLGALLHDIGQIYWSDELLTKRERPLTREEQMIIESHTHKGINLVQNWPLLCFVQPYILYHQEWIDGSGYPYGLQGESIPLEVQVVSLADVYEALRYPRAYKQRSGYSSEEILAIMRQMRGKRWNAGLFDSFVEIARCW